ncbi:poly(ADP-ribose) polymerase family member 14-related sequence 1 isoform X2 [Embiotoca jacksoni]|uniref:poly(ADP-ribose) polymerase family member 14-related sequence 1 isoform X2 n=1 Tax=Embiotoca jacksoni TaxID=100190 RepID=UPI00370401A4
MPSLQLHPLPPFLRQPFHFLGNKSESIAADEFRFATMAAAYSYPLLVEFKENDIPRLKNQLVKYFQSKKSNGGDCEVDYDSGSTTATLRFRNEEDQRNVLGKATHKISSDKWVLTMTVRVPTDAQDAPTDKGNKKYVAVTPTAKVQNQAEGRDDDTADEDLRSTSTVIENIPQVLNQEYLEMLVESILKNYDSPSANENFILEVFRDINSAVVTFQSGKENADFITKCTEHSTFMKKKLSARPLEVTDQVVVEDDRNLSDAILRLHFEGEGADVEDVTLNKMEESAVITFKDPQDVKKILKKQHHIKQKEIRVYPFYKSLGIVLYGKDKPSLKLPAAISEPIEDPVWRYLTQNQSAAETVHSNLKKHFCSVNLAKPIVCLSPESSLLEQKNAKALIKEWADTAKSVFAQAVSKFKSLKFVLESEVWEESEKEINQALPNKGVLVVPDKAKGVLHVVGLVNDVNGLEKTLSEVINEIVKRAKREKLSETCEIKVTRSVFHLLCQDGFQNRLLQVYPQLKMSFEGGSPNLQVEGLQQEILAAKQTLLDAVLSLKRQTVEVHDFLLEFLRDEQQEQLTEVFFTSNRIEAAFEISAYKVQLLAVSDKNLKDAEDHLRRLLISQYIDVEDTNVLGKPEWKLLVSQFENDNSMPSSRTQIRITGQQVVVSGHNDRVKQVSSKLNDFLTQNAQVEETVVVKSNTIIEYIQNHNTSLVDQLQGKVVVSYGKEAIHLSGSRVDVASSKTSVENLVSSVFFDRLQVAKPGVKKLFKEKGAMFVSTLKNSTGCLVRMVDETLGGQDNLAPTTVQTLYQLQTSDGVEIAVCKANMCSYPVHAVVSPLSPDLKHSGGLAKALLKAAGPQLQDQCNKLINSGQKLKPGNCVITGAGGQLSCNKIIHAVAPQFDSAKPQKAQALLKKAVLESLNLAEGHNCISVAVPAIGSGQGFPFKLCAAIIVKAVKEYCDERFEDNTLKKIHFVNNDDVAAQAMKAAVIQEFGSHGVSQSQQTKPAIPIKSPLVKGVGSGSFLCRVQTKEGLDITLTKGNIEVTTTEVVVNSISDDLDLNKGAVSKAILGAAGTNLQQLVNAKKPSGSANVGEVIVTDGCKLKSRFVFHSVSPQWDNGQGTAEKTLNGILKDCLGKAEGDGLTSISFPAIGTGNLGFPKDLVASVMLDAIVAFSSSKQPKHLKKVMIILYPGDTQTIQEFSDEFQKKFPSASGGSVSASSPQSPAGPFSKVVSSSGMHETKMGNVTVQVVTGDITKETSDVVVNSTNEKFNLKSGVSKAILEAAGPAVAEECLMFGAQPNPGMIMTQAGKLNCKKILHLVGQSDQVKINKAVKDALQMCANNYTSVSFPAIGTGQGNVQVKQVADAMLDAVIDVFSQNPSSALTTVRIVIFQKQMLKEFHTSMQERGADDSKDNGTIWGKIKSFFVGDSTDKPQKKSDFSIVPQKVDPTCFHICGDTQANVISAMQNIQKLISQEQNSVSINDNFILSLSDADHQCIADIQKTMDVAIGIESKLNQGSITIEGLHKDVLEASREINKILSMARDKDELKNKVEQAGLMADWQYQQQGVAFQSVDPLTNFQLEEALKNGDLKVTVKIQGQDYTVNMPSGPATDSQGSVLQIKRINRLKDEDEPEHWVPIPANTLIHVVTIAAGTPEHNEILKLFQASCTRTVTKIERIQNPVLWKSLQVKKRLMEKTNGHKNNEKRLFHGTCEDTVPTINMHGFNRSYAGKNAAAYGNGTYFAVNAKYSEHDTYSKPNKNQEKFMYVCRVLTGDFTTGQSGMITPPPKAGATSLQMYDSVVDKMANPTMFVIFHDAHAYPEYLITFK